MTLGLQLCPKPVLACDTIVVRPTAIGLGTAPPSDTVLVKAVLEAHPSREPVSADATSQLGPILSVKSPTQATARVGDWKLIRHSTDATVNAAPKAHAKKKAATSEPIELDNLATNIGETTNLAEKESQRVATLKERLAERMKNAVPSGAPAGTNAE